MACAKSEKLAEMGLEGLNGIIKGLESQESWQSQRQFRLVVTHWPKAVGFAVARQTRPISIQRSSLYVATATATWAHTLTYERLNILRKLNRYQKTPLKNIRFSTAQWTQPTSANLTSADRGKSHPSYVGEDATRPSGVHTASALDPNDAFVRWSQTMRQLQQSQPTCPNCKCACPQGELDRWAVCSLCAAKKWR